MHLVYNLLCKSSNLTKYCKRVITGVKEYKYSKTGRNIDQITPPPIKRQSSEKKSSNNKIDPNKADKVIKFEFISICLNVVI